MKRKLLLLLIFAFQGAVSAWAQTPQASPTPAPEPQRPEDIDVVRITTNLVQVDAVVTDNKGKIVTDLKPQEIQIFEDGRQQKLTHFTFITTAPPETASVPEVKPRGVDKNALPPPPTRLKQEDVRRTIAIVVDDLGLSFESTYFVRRALKKFVDDCYFCYVCGAEAEGDVLPHTGACAYRVIEDVAQPQTSDARVAG